MAVKASRATEMNVWWNESRNSAHTEKRPRGLGYVFLIAAHKWTPVFVLHATINIRTLCKCAGFRYDTRLTVDRLRCVEHVMHQQACGTVSRVRLWSKKFTRALGRGDTRSSLRLDCVLWQSVLYGQLESPLSIAKQTERSQREKRVIRPNWNGHYRPQLPVAPQHRVVYISTWTAVSCVVLRVIKWKLFHRWNNLLRNSISKWAIGLAGGLKGDSITHVPGMVPFIPQRRYNKTYTIKKQFLWWRMTVTYIFWEDRQPCRDVCEKLALFLLSDAGDFVPCAKMFLPSPLLPAFFTSTLLENKHTFINIQLKH